MAYKSNEHRRLSELSRWTPTTDEEKKKHREYMKSYREKNRERIRERERNKRKENPEKYREWSRFQYSKNKKRRSESTIKYRKSRTPEQNAEILAKKRKYYQENKDKIRAAYKKNLENNKNARLARSLRSRLREALNGGCKKGSAVQYLGCTISELKIYIENLFTSEMNWSNYGNMGWHIDHIKPLSKFNLEDEQQLKIACHYTNLQPLWWRDNISKGNKLIAA